MTSYPKAELIASHLAIRFDIYSLDAADMSTNSVLPIICSGLLLSQVSSRAEECHHKPSYNLRRAQGANRARDLAATRTTTPETTS